MNKDFLEKILKYIEYDEENKIINIYLPDDLKIKINNLNLSIDNEYNLNVQNDINLISHKGNILIDSNPEKAIHLNSYISKFSQLLKDLYNKIYPNNKLK